MVSKKLIDYLCEADFFLSHPQYDSLLYLHPTVSISQHAESLCDKYQTLIC